MRPRDGGTVATWAGVPDSASRVRAPSPRAARHRGRTCSRRRSPLVDGTETVPTSGYVTVVVEASLAATDVRQRHPQRSAVRHRAAHVLRRTQPDARRCAREQRLLGLWHAHEHRRAHPLRDRLARAAWAPLRGAHPRTSARAINSLPISRAPCSPKAVTSASSHQSSKNEPQGSSPSTPDVVCRGQA